MAWNSAPNAIAPTPQPTLAQSLNDPYACNRVGPRIVTASASVSGVCGDCATARPPATAVTARNADPVTANASARMHADTNAVWRVRTVPVRRSAE